MTPTGRRVSCAAVALGLALAACARTRPATPSPGPATAPPAAAGATVASGPPLDYWRDRRDLIRAPPPPAPRKLELPPIARWKLKNGLDVLVVPRAELPVTSFGVAVKAGGYDEQRRSLGVATFTAEMLRKGTSRRSADQIAEAIDSVGGSLDTGASSEHSRVSCSALSRHSPLCLDLIADVLLHPTFPEEEMAEVRDALTGAIKQRYDDPRALGEAHFDNLLFGEDHPDGWVAMPEDVERIGRQDLTRFWRTFYRPSNSLLVVAGDVDLEGLRAEIQRRLGPWPDAAVPARVEPRLPEHHGARYVLVDKEDLTQATLIFGHAGLKHTDPDWYATTVVNYVLGGSDFSSRLMVELRARRGLTYGISSSFGASLYQGAFEVTAATRNESAWEALSAGIAEIRRMKAEGPTEGELAKARGFYAGSYPFSLQSAASVAGGVAEAVLHGLGLDYVENLAVRLGQVQPPQARAAAHDRLRPDDLIVVMVGRGQVVAPQLEKAKVPFERVGYRDAISAKARAASASPPRSAPPGPSPAPPARPR